MAGPDPAAAGAATRRRGDGNLGASAVGAAAFRGRVVCSSGFSDQAKVCASVGASASACVCAPTRLAPTNQRTNQPTNQPTNEP